MVGFIDLRGPSLSHLDLLVLNFAIKSGHQIEGHEKLTRFVQEGGYLYHPELVQSLKICPKDSSRSYSVKDLIGTDPFVKGMKAAFAGLPGNSTPNPFEKGDNIILDALNLQYELGYAAGQCYKKEFEKQKEKLYIRELARHFKEGDESDRWN